MVLALLHEHLHPLEGHEDGLGGARHHRAAQLARRLTQAESVPKGPPVLGVTAEHDGTAREPELRNSTQFCPVVSEKQGIFHGGSFEYKVNFYPVKVHREYCKR